MAFGLRRTGLAYVNASTDSFRERGGIAVLRASDDDNDVTYSPLGLRASSMTATIQTQDLRADEALLVAFGG